MKWGFMRNSSIVSASPRVIGRLPVWRNRNEYLSRSQTMYLCDGVNSRMYFGHAKGPSTSINIS